MDIAFKGTLDSRSVKMLNVTVEVFKCCVPFVLREKRFGKKQKKIAKYTSEARPLSTFYAFLCARTKGRVGQVRNWFDFSFFIRKHRCNNHASHADALSYGQRIVLIGTGFISSSWAIPDLWGCEGQAQFDDYFTHSDALITLLSS